MHGSAEGLEGRECVEACGRMGRLWDVGTHVTRACMALRAGDHDHARSVSTRGSCCACRPVGHTTVGLATLADGKGVYSAHIDVFQAQLRATSTMGTRHWMAWRWQKSSLKARPKTQWRCPSDVAIGLGSETGRNATKTGTRPFIKQHQCWFRLSAYSCVAAVHNDLAIPVPIMSSDCCEVTANPNAAIRQQLLLSCIAK
jgi:hypothetical protein